MTQIVGLEAVITADFGDAGFEVHGWNYPYFILEKVEPKYRPFASAAEFDEHCDRWVLFLAERRRPSRYHDAGVFFGTSYFTLWKDLLSEAKWLDNGEPCGVKE